MTTNHAAARLTAVHLPAEPPDDAEVPERLRDTVLSLLAGLDRAPRSVRVRANQVEIELEWPEHEPSPAPSGPAAPDPAPAQSAESTGGQYLTAHSVGVFYRAPEPGAKPFVDVGDVVSPGQQIGIIEAMKLMIPVEANVAGRIVDVLVSDGAPVEYGDRLFAVEPVDG